MYQRIFRTVTAFILTLSLGASSAGLAASALAADAEVIRIGGETRVQTASLIADEGWNNCGTVLLANAYSFPDALAGVPLAGALGAPILLTGNGGSLESDVHSQLERLGVRNVYILGGTSAVSEEKQKELADMGLRVTRLSGSDRFETAVSIARKLIELCGQVPEELFLASSANYPDALAAGPAAAVQGSPILYVRPDGTFNAATADFIRELTDLGLTKACVLGGSSAVAGGAEDNLLELGIAEVGRISGDNRYDTALAINTAYADLLDADALVAATGTAFPDALAGGALAAFNGSPIVLLPNRTDNAGVAEYISGCGSDTVYVLGGESAISAAVAESYFARPSAASYAAEIGEEVHAGWFSWLTGGVSSN